MPTESVTSQGTKVQFSASSPVTFVDIPGVKGVSLSIVVAEFEDITNLGSTGGFREKLPIMKNGDKVPFEMVAAIATPNATQLALQSSALSQALGYAKIIPFGAGSGMSSYTFACYVSKFILKSQTAKVQTFSVEFEITGPVTPA